MLTRLPDVDGKVNFSHSPVEERMFPRILVSFDWEEIRKKASKLEVGESIIINYD
jgi:hypothetical protein